MSNDRSILHESKPYNNLHHAGDRRDVRMIMRRHQGVAIAVGDACGSTDAPVYWRPRRL